MAAAEPAIKRPGEVKVYEFRFLNHPEIADNGDKLSGTPTVAAAVSGLTIGTPAKGSDSQTGDTLTSVYVSISSGTDGTVYDLLATCGTVGGLTLQCAGQMRVSSKATA